MTRFESEYKLLFHCAPTIYGVKSANLFSLQNVSDNEVITALGDYSRMLSHRGLKVRIMCRCGKNVLFYVYSTELLKKQLASHHVREFLRCYGYSDFSDAETVLDRLYSRIGSSDSFPHEIGIFLDYPLSDVKGFITNKGRNFKYSGCWKVYSDVPGCVRKFRSYDSCREDACAKLRSGLSVSEVLLSA